MMRNAVLCATAAIALLGFVGGCDDDDPAPPEPLPELFVTVIADRNLVLDGELPTIGDAIARGTLIERDPRLEAVINAVEGQRPQQLLTLADWQERSCATRASWCPGLPRDAMAPTVDVGSAVSFYVTHDEVLFFLEQLVLGTEPLMLTFASARTDDTNRYYLAFESTERRGTGRGPVLYDGVALFGMLLEIDLSRAAPIVRFDFGLRPDYPSEQIARDIGLEHQKILVLEDVARIKPQTP